MARRRAASGRRARSVRDLLYVALPVGSAQGIQGAIRITYPASVVDDRIRHIWLLLAATGGVVLGIVFLVSLLLARSVTRAARGARARGRGARWRRPRGARRGAEWAGRGDGARGVVQRDRGTARTARRARSGRSWPTRRTSCARRSPRSDSGSRTSKPMSPEHAAEDLDGALAEVRRLSRLVDGLLALTNAEQSTATPASISVDELLDGRCDAWEAFAAERHVEIESSVRRRPFVRATPGRLEQVVDNLLNNALEVAPEGSAVRLAALDRGRLGGAPRQRRRAGHDRRRASPCLRPVLAVGGGAARRTSERPLRARPRDRARARRGRRRRRAAGAVVLRWARGDRADAAGRARRRAAASGPRRASVLDDVGVTDPCPLDEVRRG